MKHLIKGFTLFLTVMLLASAASCLHVSATSVTSTDAATDTYRHERLQALFALYARYRDKEDADGSGAYPTSDMLWDDYLTPLSKLTGADAADRALIDLIYYKGAAFAPLSHIYHSHGGTSQSAEVQQIYREQSVLILSKTRESSDLGSFFEGFSGSAPLVYDCYITLLNAIYTERLHALAHADDSPEVHQILTDAVARLLDPNAAPVDPELPTPTYASLEDEDAEVYKTYLATVEERVARQRNRDLVKTQLTLVYRALYPSASFTALEELAQNHSAIDTFLTALPQASSVIQVNTLLSDAVVALLDELTEQKATYTKQYLKTVLRGEVIDAVALASGAIPNPRVVNLMTACFGKSYQLKMTAAEGKDRLVAATQAFPSLTPEQQTRLEEILLDYTGGANAPSRLDACQTRDELTEELLRADYRLEWFTTYLNTLKQIDDALDRYASPALTQSDRDGIRARATAQHAATDQAIRDGGRDLSTTPPYPLEKDWIAMTLILRDAEILSFCAKHPLVTAPPSNVTRDHRDALAAAITDAATLSDAAMGETGLRQPLRTLGGCYKLAILDELRELLQEPQGSGNSDASLQHWIRSSLRELEDAVTALSELDSRGVLALTELMAQADRLARQGEQIDRLLEAYERQILPLSPTQYLHQMQQICADALNTIRQAPNHTEATVVEEALIRLHRLCSLERIWGAVQAHTEFHGATDFLAQAEAALLPDAAHPPVDLAAFEAELLSRLQDHLRSDAAKQLKAIYEDLLKRQGDYAPEQLARLKSLYAQALSDTGAYLLPDATEKATLSHTVASAIAAMQAVPLDRLSTSADSTYVGSVEAKGEIAANASLTILSSAHTPEEIAKRIQQAAKEDRIGLADGSSLPKALRKRLKECSVSAAMDIQLNNTAAVSSTCYALSVSLSDHIDLSRVLGVISIREDGSMEFHEASVEELLLQFQASHFSEYYVVSEGAVNLLPWILLLGLVLVCEGGILFALYRRRHHEPTTAVANSLFLPLSLLRIAYTPKGGLAVLGLMGVAAVALGVWIAALLLAERKAAKRNARAKIPALVAPVTVGCLEGAKDSEPLPTVPDFSALPPPLSEVTAEDAELLMSDEEAAEYRQIEYEDEEEYCGNKRAQINLDSIAKHFEEGEIVHLNSLKEKKLISKNVGFVKILARGTLDKPLTVLAQDFSTAAVKMILLTGGKPVVTHASPERGGYSKRNA